MTLYGNAVICQDGQGAGGVEPSVSGHSADVIVVHSYSVHGPGHKGFWEPVEGEAAEGDLLLLHGCDVPTGDGHSPTLWRGTTAMVSLLLHYMLYIYFF